MTAVLLHGFWGQPRDWNGVLAGLPLGKSVLVPDLYEAGPLAPTSDLQHWPANFWHWLEHEVGGAAIELVGYSMGARLAMQALLAHPERVARALLISGRPWIEAAAVEERRAWEQAQAEKFKALPWEELEKLWQEQAVFAHTQPLARRHDDSKRDLLARSLTAWSPTRHNFGLRDLSALHKSVEWAYGARDEKYLEVAETLRRLPVQGEVHVIPEVGHRVVPEASAFVSRWLAGR